MTCFVRRAKYATCAWCCWTYDRQTGVRIRRLSDSEYALVQSHGCCPECQRNMLNADHVNKQVHKCYTEVYTTG
jgi:hypothetical protein